MGRCMASASTTEAHGIAFEPMRRPNTRVFLFFALSLITAGSILRLDVRATNQAATSSGIDQSLLAGLRWRSIGPARGGRSQAVAGSTKRPSEYYFGATGGGVWKTTDGGINWRPVTDR